MKDLTLSQQALVMAATNELNNAGVDFVLIVRGEDGGGALFGSICADCAADLLTVAARAASERAAAGSEAPAGAALQ